MGPKNLGLYLGLAGACPTLGCLSLSRSFSDEKLKLKLVGEGVHVIRYLVSGAIAKPAWPMWVQCLQVTLPTQQGWKNLNSDETHCLNTSNFRQMLVCFTVFFGVFYSCFIVGF